VSSGLLKGAHHYVLEGIGHTGLMYDQRVIELVSDILAGAEAPLLNA
jgi:hypothetical protein